MSRHSVRRPEGLLPESLVQAMRGADRDGRRHYPGACKPRALIGLCCAQAFGDDNFQPTPGTGGDRLKLRGVVTNCCPGRHPWAARSVRRRPLCSALPSACIEDAVQTSSRPSRCSRRSTARHQRDLERLRLPIHDYKLDVRSRSGLHRGRRPRLP